MLVRQVTWGTLKIFPFQTRPILRSHPAADLQFYVNGNRVNDDSLGDLQIFRESDGLLESSHRSPSGDYQQIFSKLEYYFFLQENDSESAGDPGCVRSDRD